MSVSVLRKILLTVYRCMCERCGHVWISTSKATPTACAGCKTKYWSTPAGELPRGRPSKKA